MWINVHVSECMAIINVQCAWFLIFCMSFFSQLPTAIDSILTLDNLLIQIKSEVTPKWHQFGKAMRVDDKVLNKCLQYAQEESIIEVCDKWLRNHSGKPTWREVAEALRQIGYGQLANDIENAYNTGNKINVTKIN